MTETTFDVHVEREFDAPIERVWAAWTVPDDLRAWWGPTGFTCPHAEVDLREGGRIFVTMRAPDEWGGLEYPSTWDITDDRAPAAAALRVPVRGCRGHADHSRPRRASPMGACPTRASTRWCSPRSKAAERGSR